MSKQNRKTRKKPKSNHTNMAEKRKAQAGFRDLLFPIVAVIALLPLIVYLKVVSTGLGKYDFFPLMDVSYDFYTYYRTRVFVILMAAALVVLVAYRLLYRKEEKSLSRFWMIGVMAGLCILSAVFSEDKTLSMHGSVNSGQSLWVALGYMVLFLYTYEMMQSEHDYKLVLISLIVFAVCMIGIGLFQMTGNDPLSLESIQKLCMNAEDQERYLGKVGSTFSGYYVFLTLFNPNYAAVMLAMGIVFCFSMLTTSARGAKKEKICCFIFLLLQLLLLYFTFSRMGFVAMFTGIVACMFVEKAGKKYWFALAGSILLGIVLFTGLDAMRGFKFYHRLTDEKKQERLTDLETDEKGVHLTYMGQEYLFTLDMALQNESKSVCEGEGSLTKESVEGEDMLVLTLCGEDWYFGWENGSYYYLNPFGKHQVLNAVEKVDFHGMESFASGRGYFWSRLLPKLRQSILIGSGPDTMIVLFPQDDYAGRLQYSEDLTMICDRAHSGYLQVALEMGIVFFLLFVWFLVRCMKNAIPVYLHHFKESGQEGMERALSLRMGTASWACIMTYLVSLLTNDITIFTMPIACVLMGMTMASAEKNKLPVKGQ